jgi:lactoylglutathione lyase
MPAMTTSTMPLGAFSVSLAVKDLAASTAFYESLGFSSIAGDGQHMAILRNGTTTVGLFRGMFQHNMLTFNPGWDASCQRLEEFVDVRELLRRVQAAGLDATAISCAGESGPGSFIVIDPDGNPVLVDQHV